MYKTSGHLPYYAESMFPKMERWWPCASTEHSTEHREARVKLQARIAELEKQLADYAKKKSGG